MNPVLGVDLGSAGSRAATVGLDGVAVRVIDRSVAEGEPTPTAVTFAEGAMLVGAAAEAVLRSEQAEVATSAIEADLGQPAALLRDEEGEPWTASGLAALVLRKLLADGEAHMTRAATGAVLTTADAATPEQRRGLRNAAYLAGLQVLDVIDESLAALLHYRSAGRARGTTVLCDFGASGFRASVYRGGEHPLGTVHRPEAAGDRLDAALLERLLARAGARADQLQPRRRRSLLLSVRQLRHQLGRGGTDATLVFPLDGRLVAAALSTAELRRLTAPLLEKVATGIAEALETAEVGLGEVEEVLLAGGFADGLGVRAALETLFGRSQARIVAERPRDAVALGAALRAAELAAAGRSANLPPEYRGVTPTAVGVRVLEQVTGLPGVDVLVTKGMALPCSSRRMYYTSQEQQDRLVFELVGVDGKEVEKLGELALDALASRRRGHAIELSLEIGLDGVMQVETYDSDSGNELAARFHGRSDVVDPGTVLYLDRVRTANIVSAAGAS